MAQRYRASLAYQGHCVLPPDLQKLNLFFKRLEWKEKATTSLAQRNVRAVTWILRARMIVR